MALSLDGDQGAGAGQWSLFAADDNDVKLLTSVESPSKEYVRLFLAHRGAIFRRFWFRMVDPTPEERHVGSFDDITLTSSSAAKPSRESPIDLNTPAGRAVWSTGRAASYSCSLSAFRETGSCSLERAPE
jgi:hypothetical protein